MTDSAARNSTPQAVAARVTRPVYTTRQGYARMPQQATQPAPFVVLAEGLVSAEVADHARLVALYNAAQADVLAHGYKRDEAVESDALALAVALRNGKADPGDVATMAYTVEDKRLARLASGLADALSASWEDLTTAISVNSAAMTLSFNEIGDDARRDLADALDAAQAAVAAIQATEDAISVIAHTTEQGADMRAVRLRFGISHRAVAQETYGGVNATTILDRLRIETIPTAAQAPEPEAPPADVFDDGLGKSPRRRR